MARPSSRSPAMSSRVVRRASGSMPAVGSSRMRTSGSPTRARARASRWRSPPERRRARVRATARGRPGREARRGRGRHRGTERTGEARPVGVARGSRPPPWSISPSRALRAGPPRCGSSPRTRTVPPSAGRYPSRISTVVVLPAPFGPRSATSSPRATDRVSPLRIVREPYRFTTWSRRSRAGNASRVGCRHGAAEVGGPAIFARRHVEVGGGELADLDPAQDALAIDEVGLRPGDGAIGGADGAVRVVDRRPGGVIRGHEVAGRARRIEHQDPDQGEVVRLVLRELVDEERELVPARDARRPPEVDDDGPPAKVRQRKRRAVERRAREGWSGAAGRDPGRIARRRRAVQVHDAQDDRRGQGRECDGDDDRSPSRIDPRTRVRPLT